MPFSEMEQQHTIDVQEARTALEDSDLVSRWDHLLRQHWQPTNVYASPSWVAHLEASSEGSVRVWRIFDPSDTLVGVVPVWFNQFTLRFSTLKWTLYRKRLPAAHLLGGGLLVPQSPDILSRLLSSIFSDLPGCRSVYAEAVPTDSGFWKRAQAAPGALDNFRLYVVSGPRPWHTLVLKSSFDAYLKAMSAKARANLRREVRKLNAVADDRLVLSRCTTEQEAEAFYRGAVDVSRRSWQQQAFGTRIKDDPESLEAFKDLSRRGLLRCYLLSVADKPCAFVIGYQHYGVYCYSEIGYDQQLSAYSPGKVLLFLIVEDLHNENRPDVLDFGVGDAAYKRRFGNCMKSDVACLVMPKTVRNAALLSSHSLFTHAVKLAKKVIGRRVTK
jgi:hypothetical protein